jgi:hypothetical protein
MREVGQSVARARVVDHPDHRRRVLVTRQRPLSELMSGVGVSTALPARSTEPIGRLVVPAALAPPHHVIGHDLHDAVANTMDGADWTHR